MTSSVLNALKAEMLIGGLDVASSHTFEVRDPGRTGDLVATVSSAKAADVDAAVEAARAAAADWARVNLAERIRLLGMAVATVEAEVAELALLLTRENGGTLLESTMDLSRAMQLFRDFLGRAAEVLAPQVADTASHWLSRERTPVGVCALIVPWNSPIVLTASKLAPALVAGNTVVVKPSVLAPVTLGIVLSTLARGLPAGVINVVHGDAPVGGALVAHAEVRKVSFTGSVAVGRQIMSGAGATVKNVSLELGGNDPAILLQDVDLNASIPALARGIYTRAGQICFAIKRVYVPRARHDEIVEALAAEVSGFRVGHGLDPETTFGPLISAAAKDRVEGLIERADAGGATVRQLGSPTAGVDWQDGHYMLPTLVYGIDHGAELVTVEQFGPVVPVVAYDDVDDAVAMANDSEFGLCSSVWSADTDTAIAVARRLKAGGSFINSHNVSSLSFDMPFGGVKQSGLGRERTELGLLEYIEEHAIRLAH